MCRHFPAGSKILRLNGDLPEGVSAVAALTPDGSYSVAFVNWGEADRTVRLEIPGECKGYSMTTFDGALHTLALDSNKCFDLVLSSGTFAIFASE